MKKIFLLALILAAIAAPSAIAAPTGAINGRFSVNDKGDAVYFSKGNLQYQGTTQTWRFAEHQWDYVGHNYPDAGNIHSGNVSGSTNEKIASGARNSGWIDLFGWGTSGFNGKMPYLCSIRPEDYGSGSKKDIAGTHYDWGVHNAISNGGNEAGLWRTPTQKEWEYIIQKRKTSSGIRFALGTVNGVHGLILLPDEWSASTYALKGTNNAWPDGGWMVNNISASDWNRKLEPAGAVFLPAAGSRGDINYDDGINGGGTGPEGMLPFMGFYQSSAIANFFPDDHGNDSSHILYFTDNAVRPEYSIWPCIGCSVRLVTEGFESQAPVAVKGSVPEGAINGSFSVDPQGDAIYFSKGNLQYQGTTKTWRFAEHQWDYVGHNYPDAGNIHSGTVSGSTNEKIASGARNSGWIDLFGWGTSGFNGKMPYLCSIRPEDYGSGSKKDIAGTHYDWGVHNAISNGGNEAGLWRTPTQKEWEYIIQKRKTSSGIRFALGTVNGVHGLILLPDEWSASTYALKGTNNAWPDGGWMVNNISASDWNRKLEPAGAVFLPAAGSRGDINYDDGINGGGTGPEGMLPFIGYYQTSTIANFFPDDHGNDSSHILFFTDNAVRPEYSIWPCIGCSVRLVTDK